MPSLIKHQNILEYHLGEIDTILNDLGITYFAAYGTMLGAVRHKGFIPWDDDLDIMMMPEDILKLDVAFKNRQMGYRLEWSENLPFPKIIPTLDGTSEGNDAAIWIDIFPIDFVGDSLPQVRKTALRLSNFFPEYAAINSRWPSLFHRWQKRERNPLIYVGRVFRRVYVKLHPASYKKRISKYQRDLLSNPRHTKYAFPQSWEAEPNNQPLLQSVFSSKARYQFGRIQIWGLKDYDAYLRHLYGDYMTIPKSVWTHCQAWEEDIDAIVEEARKQLNQ